MVPLCPGDHGGRNAGTVRTPVMPTALAMTVGPWKKNIVLLASRISPSRGHANTKHRLNAARLSGLSPVFVTWATSEMEPSAMMSTSAGAVSIYSCVSTSSTHQGVRVWSCTSRSHNLLHMFAWNSSRLTLEMYAFCRHSQLPQARTVPQHKRVFPVRM